MRAFKKITSVLCVLLGIAVIAMGVTIVSESPKAGYDSSYSGFKHDADYYSADYASFGGDYYTYSYKANRIMVDELNDINSAMATLVRAQNTIIETVSDEVNTSLNLIESIEKVGGILTCAIGVGILAFSLQYVGNAFSEKPSRKKQAAPAVPFTEV